MTRVERTSAFDVMLTIGPAQAMSSMSMQPSAPSGMGQSHDMSMGGQQDMDMQAHQADQGMAVNHWLDVHVTQAGSSAVVSDLTPTIRIVDKSSGEARDLPGIMAMSGGMNASDYALWTERIPARWHLPDQRAARSDRYRPIPRCGRREQPDDGRTNHELRDGRGPRHEHDRSARPRIPDVQQFQSL